MFANLPPATRSILVANLIVFGLQALLPEFMTVYFALWPLHVNFDVWQLVTYAFLHGGLAHIAFNMFGLVMFGADLERVWGTNRFTQYYFASVLAAALTQLLITTWLGDAKPTVGASGGIYGLVLGFAIMFPERRIVPLFPPIPMPARVFALIFATLELVLGVSGTQSGIAHFAHLGGMLGGWLMLRHWASARRG
jgi:membrane associated rhomboid family serine protease